jgi:hypothetical protein
MVDCNITLTELLGLYKLSTIYTGPYNKSDILIANNNTHIGKNKKIFKTQSIVRIKQGYYGTGCQAGVE